MKYIPFILLLAGLVSSCFSEYRTFIDYSIQNNSTSVITLSGSEIIHARNLDQTINPGDKVVLTEWTRMGRSIGQIEPSLIFGEDLVILNATGDTLKKDFHDGKNWVQDLSTTRETATHKYEFEILDRDFR
ncbi:MAG: hypothetical protein KDD63_11575 [Bacteroidetes bacterium]|nr:hypothetical protein [Bacteroidota bacterium]MCB0842454.1 hypothetical protein [Bacteroidota bacterium]MCB0852859.1 hypothetical protein [Bacteroidota bacterium]